MNDMHLRASDFRKKARESLKGNWKKGIIVFSGAAILSYLSFIFTYMGLGAFAFSSYRYVVWGIILPLFTLILNVSVNFVIFQFGLTLYSKKIAFREEPKVSDLFGGFNKFFKVFVLFFLEYLFMYLWLLLFIIPGIIAYYRYSLAVYILIDNPNKDPFDCIVESKKIMRGRKFRLFCLDMSFIGWVIVVLFLIFAIFTPFLNIFPIEFATIGVLDLILMILIFPVILLYMLVARAEFYKEVMENELSDSPVELSSKDIEISDSNDNCYENNMNYKKEDVNIDYSSKDDYMKYYYRDPSEFGHSSNKDDKDDKDDPEL